jgi:hypothetical protein
MKGNSLENALLPIANPILKSIIKRFDIDCEQDGSLLINSLKDFLGENVKLCRTCSSLNRIVAKPFYKIGSKALRVDANFMGNKFFDKDYGEAWFKGFALMMKGIRKYGIRIPFAPAGPFEIVWNFTYRCNLKCKHCYEDAGVNRLELSTEQAYEAIDELSGIAHTGIPALSFSGGEPLIRKISLKSQPTQRRKYPSYALQQMAPY